MQAVMSYDSLDAIERDYFRSNTLYDTLYDFYFQSNLA